MIQVLCLHGYGTSPEFMKHQMRYFAQNFPEMQFTYMPAPLEIPKNFITDKAVIKLTSNGKYYAWKSHFFDDIIKDGVIDFSLAVKGITDYINKHGPFDGICGFSQGAMFGHLFLEEYEQGKLVKELKVEAPKFAILCSPNYFNKVNKLLKTRTVHFIGEKDLLVDNSLLVTTKFLDPLVFVHSEGHKFPRLRQRDIDAIKTHLYTTVSRDKLNKSKPQPKL